MRKKFVFSFFAVILLSLFFSPSMTAQNNESEMNDLAEMIRKCDFRIEVDRVVSSSFPNTDRFNPKGYIQLNDSVLKTDLPYFGKARMISYGNDNGVRIEQNAQISRMKVKKKEVTFKIKARNKQEHIEFTFSFYPGGKALVIMTGSQRESITYFGSYSFQNE